MSFTLPHPAYFDGLVYVPIGDPAKDAENRLAIFELTGAIPQHVMIGRSPEGDQ